MKSTKYIQLVILVLLIGVAVLLLVTRWKDIQTNFSKLTTSSTTTPKPTPTPTKSPFNLPTGPQVFKFSHGDKVVGPKIKTATINTLTPGPNQDQTVSVVINNDTPVTQATAILVTDHTQQSYPLTMTKGTATNGTWEASWKITDTYDYRYLLNFDLRSSSGNYSGGLTFRLP